MPTKQRIYTIILALVAFMLVSAKSYANIYYPHVDTKGDWETEICLINTDAAVAATGTLKGYSDNGTEVSSTPLTLAPNARHQIIVGQELANPDQIGYMVFESSATTVAGYTKFYIAGSYRSAIPAVAEINSGDIYITHIASDATWWTGISLVNTTAAQKALTLEFDNQTTKTVTLAAGEHWAGTIEGLFGGLSQPNIHSAVIRNGAGVIGLELFGSSTLLDGVPLSDKTATDLYYPHIESSNSWWTGIVAYNPGTTAVNITINSYSAAGVLLGSLQPAPIPAGGNYVRNASGLGLPAGTAWLHIHAAGPLSGFELFDYNEDQLAGYSVVNIDTKNGAFAKIEPNGWTGIAFVNIESQPANVTLTALNNSGAIVATSSIALAAHEKQVGYVENLFAPSIDGATNVRFSSDRSIVGFQLNGDDGDNLLDALPALFVSASAPPPPVPDNEVQDALDALLPLVHYQSLLGPAKEEIHNILNLFVSGGGGTCPAVTTIPADLDLENPPSEITLTVSYGTGCTSASGAQMSGEMVLQITNLHETTDSTVLNYLLTANNLTADGQLLLNGSVSGQVTLSGESDSTDLVCSAHFNNLQAGGSTISGDLSVTVHDLDLTNEESTDYDDIIVTFNNLTVEGYTVNSGTLVITSPSATQTRIAADLMTSEGAADITMIIDQPTGTRTTIYIEAEGTLAGYTVCIENLTLDTAVCEDYPIAGTIELAKGGVISTVTFTNACDGTYDLEP